MKIDDCDQEAECVLDQKKIKKKKAQKSKVTDEENFYKCKCRDLVTDIYKIRGIGDKIVRYNKKGSRKSLLLLESS